MAINLISISFMLKEKLLNYIPPTDYEMSCKIQMLDFLKEHENCFERSCLKGHFTASAWLLNKTETHALLLHHKKLDQWLQLGGHCDGDSNVLAVSIKEAQEESGVLNIKPMSESIFDLDIHTIPPYKMVPEHLHLDIRFLLKVNSDEDIIQNEESLALRWFSKDAADFPPTVMRMVEKWRNL